MRSFEIPNAPGWCEGQWNTVRIKGVRRLRFKGAVDGQARLVRIVKTPVRVVVDREIHPVEDHREPLDIDVGITARVALSNGEIVPGQPLDRSELKRRQRRLWRGSGRGFPKANTGGCTN